MRTLIIILALALPAASYAQNMTATTPDGREVVLHQDGKWEFSQKKEGPSLSTCESFLSGRWNNPLVTITFDFKKGRTIAKALGIGTERTIKIKKCTEEVAIFISGDKEEMIVRFKDKNHIIISSPAKMPLDMIRID